MTTSTASLQAYLTQLYAARDAVLTGQSYAWNGKNLVRADAGWISGEIEKTEGRISRRSGILSSNVVINPR